MQIFILDQDIRYILQRNNIIILLLIKWKIKYIIGYNTLKIFLYIMNTSVIVLLKF